MFAPQKIEASACLSEALGVPFTVAALHAWRRGRRRRSGGARPSAASRSCARRASACASACAASARDQRLTKCCGGGGYEILLEHSCNALYFRSTRRIILNQSTHSCAALYAPAHATEHRRHEQEAAERALQDLPADERSPPRPRRSPRTAEGCRSARLGVSQRG